MTVTVIENMARSEWYLCCSIWSRLDTVKLWLLGLMQQCWSRLTLVRGLMQLFCWEILVWQSLYPSLF